MDQFKNKIEVFCNNLGLDTFGFVPCRSYDELIPFYEKRIEEGLQNEFEEQNIENKITPSKYLNNGKTILSIAFPYCDQGIEQICSNGFSVYTQRKDYHKVVKSYLNQICAYIQTLGGEAIGLVDSHGLPERYMAYLAGVGFIGKNNMLITKKYGSYVFLGEIIMDLELECTEQRSFEEIRRYIECGDCENCRNECPPKAIHEKVNNANRCLSYITQKKEITDSQIKQLRGKVFGCDICQCACPYNKVVEQTNLQEFTVLPEMQQQLDIYATMDNKFFKEKISQTSCGWRGKNVIKRNAIIAQHYNGKDIIQYKSDSPYLNDYIERLQQDLEK